MPTSLPPEEDDREDDLDREDEVDRRDDRPPRGIFKSNFFFMLFSNLHLLSLLTLNLRVFVCCDMRREVARIHPNDLSACAEKWKINTSGVKRVKCQICNLQ